MTPRDLRNIHSTDSSYRDTYPCQYGTKTIPVFLPADGEVSSLLLSSSVSSLPGGRVQPENTYSCILKATGLVWESQKGKASTLITATTSIHLLKPVSTDLTIKSHLGITNPIGKDEVWYCLM